MRSNRRSGFTLVEILIVVVILGILAAIVVPQFTNASNEAIKGALSTQLQTINSQVELYRVREQGAYPFVVAADWTELVNAEYLKEEPVNGYTGETALTTGDAAAAGAETRESANGWMWQDDDTAIDYCTVYACGLRKDPTTGEPLLEHEADADVPAP